jgi:hypothetical protein
MKNFTLLVAMVALTILAVGCSNTSTTSTAGTTDAGTDSHAGHDHAAHSDTGAHGGHIIELGHNHEYHAELVDDHETETVTVYMMDGDMKPLQIEQQTVTLILTAGDESQTYELPAAGESTSEFSLSDENMVKLMDAENASGKLRVTIDDKPFSGTFDHHAHDHDHEH